VKTTPDTNVLIAAFISKGFCYEWLEHCALRHELITSNFILEELREKLTTKFKFTNEEAEEVVELLCSKMKIVEPVKFDTQICRDADDDNILGTAKAGNCDCIVTGDKDLLVLKKYEGIDIISPSEFLDYEERK
jgi:uncharacterized protein